MQQRHNCYLIYTNYMGNIKLKTVLGSPASPMTLCRWVFCVKFECSGYRWASDSKQNIYCFCRAFVKANILLQMQGFYIKP